MADQVATSANIDAEIRELETARKLEGTGPIQLFSVGECGRLVLPTDEMIDDAFKRLLNLFTNAFDARTGSFDISCSLSSK